MNLSLSGQTCIFGGVFFVFNSLLGIERQKFIFDPKASEPCQNIFISNMAKHRVTTLFLLSSIQNVNVLNSDENIVNIALITFCPLAVTKLANWPMLSLRSCGVGLCPIVCYSCRLF